MRKHIVIFASGNGSNAEVLMRTFEHHPEIEVKRIYTNNPSAGVIEKAKNYQIPCRLFERQEFREGQILKELQSDNPSLIVLAGFLWLVPASIIEQYRGKIINIHPALLPLHGGKGMYGERVHKAVLESGSSESGITIHWVDEHFDEGEIIVQERCVVEKGDSPEALAKRIHALEHNHLPKVVEMLLK